MPPRWRPALRTVVCVGEGQAGDVPFAQLAAHEAPRSLRATAIDLAALIYTSGSTGKPKGVTLTHQNMTFAAASLAEYLEMQHDEVVLLCLPLSFDYGLYQLLLTVLVGGTLVLEKGFAFPGRVVGLLESEGVTGLPGVPTLFGVLLGLRGLGDRELPALRYLSNTGAALSVTTIAGLRETFPAARIYSMYGLTECKRVSYLPPHLIDVKPASVGVAIPGTEVWVEDGDGNECAPGEIGELIVRGPHVMQGYWNDPEATAKRLRPGRWHWERELMTGDLFKRDAEGHLYFVGRKDDMIKSRGEKVAPREVEEVLYAVPGRARRGRDRRAGCAARLRHPRLRLGLRGRRARRAHAQARLRGQARGLHGPSAHRDPRRAAALDRRQDRQARAQRRGARAARRSDCLTPRRLHGATRHDPRMPPIQPSRDTDRGFSGVSLTFARQPIALTPDDLAGVDVAVLGAPFDLAVTYRPGTRFGPRAVRLAEDVGVDGRPSIELGIDPYEELTVVDYGDADAPASDVLAAHASIQARVGEILAAGAIPAVIGGDHSITLPILRALAAHHGADGFSVIHFDTHADTGEIEFEAAASRPRAAVLARGRGGRAARRQHRADRAARLLAVPGGLRPHARAGLPLAHDGRDRRARPARGAGRGDRPRPRARSAHVPDGRRRLDGPRLRARHRHAGAGRAHLARAARAPCGASPASSTSAASTWSRSRRPTTSPASRRWPASA